MVAIARWRYKEKQLHFVIECSCFSSVAYTPVGVRQIPIRSSVPIFHEGEIVGVVVVGYAMDTPKAVEALAERHKAEFTIFRENDAGDFIRISSTLFDEQGNSIVGTRMEDPELI